MRRRLRAGGRAALPAMLFMLSITRTGAGDTSLLTQTYTLGTLLERVRALLMPIESNVVHAYYGDAPSWASTAAYLPVFGSDRRGRAVWAESIAGSRAAACWRFAARFLSLRAFSLETNVAYTRWW